MESESGDLMKKLIENLQGNPSLQNEYIRDQFKLHGITAESDLHNYKNLLNSMAALFYTNHRMNDVTLLFYMWRDAAIAKMKEKAKKGKDASNEKKGKAVPAIEIDTELANQEVFHNYNYQNHEELEEPSEIENDPQNNMIHIEGEESMLGDDNSDGGMSEKNFLAELKEVGLVSK